MTDRPTAGVLRQRSRREENAAMSRILESTSLLPDRTLSASLSSMPSCPRSTRLPCFLLETEDNLGLYTLYLNVSGTRGGVSFDASRHREDDDDDDESHQKRNHGDDSFGRAQGASRKRRIHEDHASLSRRSCHRDRHDEGARPREGYGGDDAVPRRRTDVRVKTRKVTERNGRDDVNEVEDEEESTWWHCQVSWGENEAEGTSRMRDGRVRRKSRDGQNREVERMSSSQRERCVEFRLSRPIDYNRVTVRSSRVLAHTLIVRMPQLIASAGGGELIVAETKRERKRQMQENVQLWTRLELRCRRCGHVLIPCDGRVRRVRRLPNPRWMTLDGWCGAVVVEDDAADANRPPPPLGVWAERGVCGVGRSQLLYHRDMFRPGTITILRGPPVSTVGDDDTSQDDVIMSCCGASRAHWKGASRGRVFCARCERVVGAAFGSNPIDGTTTCTDVALFKFRLAASRVLPSRKRRRRQGGHAPLPNVLRLYDVASVVGPLLLECVRRRKCYRVVLSSELTSRRYVRVCILSTATELLVSREWETSSSESTSVVVPRRVHHASRPVVRVAFLDDDATRTRDVDTAQELRLPSDVMTQCIAYLNASHLILPPERRQFGKYKVGFIEW